MLCFVCLDNNVLQAECVCVCICVEQRLCLGADNWKLENMRKASDGDKSVATGVFNFARSNVGTFFSSIMKTSV